MLHAQIRQARIDHGYSQAKLALLAGVPRERVRQLEQGANVTIDTLRKVVAQLPQLKTLSLGSVELLAHDSSAAEVRAILATWLETGRQLMTLFAGHDSGPVQSHPGNSGS